MNLRKRIEKEAIFMSDRSRFSSLFLSLPLTFFLFDSAPLITLPISIYFYSQLSALAFASFLLTASFLHFLLQFLPYLDFTLFALSLSLSLLFLSQYSLSLSPPSNLLPYLALCTIQYYFSLFFLFLSLFFTHKPIHTHFHLHSYFCSLSTS